MCEIRPESINSRSEFKLVLLGETTVGKTSLSLRFVEDKCPTSKASAGISFLRKSFIVRNTLVQITIWDTPGQKRYCQDTDSAIVMYDITNRVSFEQAKVWIQELKTQVQRNIVIALVGNKLDLEKYRAIKFREAEKYAVENKLIFMEISTLMCQNVNEIFRDIAVVLLGKDIAKTLPVRKSSCRCSCQ